VLPNVIAILHPGDMGAAVGACLIGRNLKVLFVSAGRSAATVSRALEAGFEDCGTLSRVLARADALVSVCPPHAALALAREVAGLGFGGIYVDANAVSPATARMIGQTVAAAGASFVDGGIIGPPPVSDGTTRFYLSGGSAGQIADLFSGSRLTAIVLEGPAGSASALKASYAAWTKGATALLAAVRALARHEGVEDALLSEWKLSQPALEKRSEAVSAEARKAWRWIGEMEEIAASFESAGLPGGFHRAAAEVYRRLAEFKNAKKAPALAQIIEAMREGVKPPDAQPPRTSRRVGSETR
jgi:3-hydroxyisobutyrate dehydrogenase-like beta-hydroxyacid dehydrogenase